MTPNGEIIKLSFIGIVSKGPIIRPRFNSFFSFLSITSGNSKAERKFVIDKFKRDWFLKQPIVKPLDRP